MSAWGITKLISFLVVYGCSYGYCMDNIARPIYENVTFNSHIHEVRRTNYGRPLIFYKVPKQEIIFKRSYNPYGVMFVILNGRRVMVNHFAIVATQEVVRSAPGN